MVLQVLVAIESTDELEQYLRVLEARRDVEAVSLRPGESVWEPLKRGGFDVVILSESLIPVETRAFINSIREIPEHPEVIAIGASGDPARRARLLAAGCLAVLPDRLDVGVLGEVLPSLIERRINDEIVRLKADRPEERYSLDDFVSQSPAMLRFLQTARRLVDADSSLLILGETGVGKERLARAIHRAGPRSSGPFMAVNCAALPEGLLESELFGHEEGAFTGATRSRRGYFELAHHGTLFLDEIGEMPIHLQVKLLRALDELKIQRVGGEKMIDIDARVMAATNRNLENEIREGRFRSDLYYRLAVVTLRIPPLRERREDIGPLAESYFEHFRIATGRRVQGFSPEAVTLLNEYGWPGNVRELINAVERAVLLCDGNRIEPCDLPRRIAQAGAPRSGSGDAPAASRTIIPEDLDFSESRRRVLRDFERDYLTRLLRSTGGRVGDAATRAGISERTLYSYLKRYDLRKEQFKPS